jgi:hypothetical protein
VKSLTVRYAFDPRLREEAHAAGRNYWYAYVEEILSRLGVSARPVPLNRCADPGTLAETGVLVLGDFRASDLPSGTATVLSRWVTDGGVLIGFATGGLDELFGVADQGNADRAEDPFAVTGYFDLRPAPVTRDCRAPVEPDQRLLIVSPIRRLRLAGGVELGRLYRPHPEHPLSGASAIDAQSPAVVQRSLGSGRAFYFGFNVAQTMWAIQQGRPIDRDYDGDGYLRVSDACVIGDNSRAVPYTDALHFLLANMIAHRPVPMIDPIPPREGRAAPCLFTFGGDDECEAGHPLAASEFMAARGLPYHINAMPDTKGRFAITPGDQARIEANGHEIALHYNFMDGFAHPGGFTRDDVRRQAGLFRERFGRDSVCGVTHWLRWCGWAEPARWMRECGNLADNSYIGSTSPPLNPVNTIGFAFGSAYPRFVWDDASHGNARLDFVELPIVAYEAGYEEHRVCPDRIRAAVDLAVQYRLTLDFFFHPVYVATSPACQAGIDELVRLMRQMPVPPVLMGPDRIAHWWRARTEATIDHAAECDGDVVFDAECAYGDGVVIKVPLGGSVAANARSDGDPVSVENVRQFGQQWAFMAVSPGRHRIRLSRSNAVHAATTRENGEARPRSP